MQAQQEDRGGPSPSAPSGERSAEAVLGEVLVNQSALRTTTGAGARVEDEDLALAKMLQEQERAFMVISGGPAAPRRVENVPPATSDAGGPPGEDGGQALTDEELAWRLMQEEEAAFQNRLYAMAGAAPASDGGASDGGDGSEGGADPDAMSYEELTALGEVVGTVSTGISAAQLAALPVRTFAGCGGGGGGGGGGEGEEQCAVCRVEYEGDDEVAVLPCGHFYHTDCIAQWLARKKVCPQCNKDVVPEAPRAASVPPGGAEAAAAPAGVLAPRQPR